MIGEFVGRVPDRPPLREQCRLVCGPVYVIVTRLVSRSTGYSGSSFFLGSVTSFIYESRDENYIFESAVRPRDHFRNFRL
jgi:hypothetical protein